ncbi:hypothetical protein [Hellea balneolensis]|uniref:hypothetical protein n=1 Tax=Hellea balneolensis TaxID=287478 RepID=UPI00041BF441|nr:hypothetical protein [Hellea balneolensis]
MTDTIHSNILIVQNDAAFGHRIAQHLYKDRQVIFGPIGKVTSAYRLLVTDPPDLAIIDASICETQIDRLSDTLVLMNIPHLINYGQSLKLKRVKVHKGEAVISEVTCKLPLEQSIAHTLWDMHLENVLSHWLDDGLEKETDDA